MSNGIDIDDLDMDTFINSLQFITTVTIDDIEPKSKNSIHPVFLTLSSSFFRCLLSDDAPILCAVACRRSYRIECRMLYS